MATDTQVSNRPSNAIRSQYRILDERQRQRRIQEAVDFLEKDNLQAEPHADLVMSKKVPKFEEEAASHQNRRFRLPRPKTLEQLIDEDSKEPPPNYLSIATRGLIAEPFSALPSYMFCTERNIPKRRFCAVCGQLKKYDCLACGSHLCSLKCKTHHEATRCIKWT